MTRPNVFYADVDPRDADLANVLHEPSWTEVLEPFFEWVIIVTAVPCLIVGLAFAIVLAAPLAMVQVLIGED
jgi:hypothetical protein